MTYTSKFYGSEPDWKKILRDVLKDANRWNMETPQGDPDVWTFQMTDERMKELEEMNLWSMERMND